MPPAVLSREGYCVQLDAFTVELVTAIRLYTNDPPLSADRVAADFTPPVYDGYGPQVLKRWTRAALRGGVAFSSADPTYFSWSGGPAPAPIRGYIATAGTDGPLLWMWRRPDDAYALGPAHPLLTILIQLYYPGLVVL